MTGVSMCKRGLHERNDENNRRRTVNSGGKTRVINECLACAREAKARKGTHSSGSSSPVAAQAGRGDGGPNPCGEAGGGSARSLSP